MDYYVSPHVPSLNVLIQQMLHAHAQPDHALRLAPRRGGSAQQQRRALEIEALYRHLVNAGKPKTQGELMSELYLGRTATHEYLQELEARRMVRRIEFQPRRYAYEAIGGGGAAGRAAQ